MKNIGLFLVLFLSLQLNILGQDRSIPVAQQIIELAKKKNQKLQFEFNDPLRVEWRRSPGPRNGLALFQMDLQQKKLLHRLLTITLSTSGYNKITHIMFNEDLAKEFDPETGQNRYWFAIYGQPAENTKWGWRLEGHHLSIHFTLMGDQVLSSTPFEIGSWPAVVEKDTVRAGFRNLSKEIDIAFELINGLGSSQLDKAIIAKTRPNERMKGESNPIPWNPIGLPFKEMNETQQSTVRRLVNEYLNNVASIERVDYSAINFAWWGATDNSSTYCYRIHNKEFLIDFENIGNHIHCVLRFLKKDFETNPYNN